MDNQDLVQSTNCPRCGEWICPNCGSAHFNTPWSQVLRTHDFSQRRCSHCGTLSLSPPKTPVQESDARFALVMSGTALFPCSECGLDSPSDGTRKKKKRMIPVVDKPIDMQKIRMEGIPVPQVRLVGSEIEQRQDK